MGGDYPRALLTALLLRRKYLLWRCALADLVIEKKIPGMALAAARWSMRGLGAIHSPCY